MSYLSSSSEACWRCGHPMEYRHSSPQCPVCQFKIGCCEGAPAAPAAPRCANRIVATIPMDKGLEELPAFSFSFV